MSDAFQLRLATSADVDLISWHRARVFQDMGELPPEYFSAAADTAASWGCASCIAPVSTSESQLRVRNGIARNFLPVRQRARAIGGVMNLMSLPFAIRYVLSVLLLTPVASFSAALVQRNPPMRPANADSPILIWDVDVKLAKSLPRNFRTTDDHLEAKSGQKIPANTGLADLRASGSGEFTADGFKLLLGRTRGPATVFDLRQETHIFVNGLPVSWFATNDWANVGRTNNEIQADEAGRVKSLGPGSKIVVHPGAAIKKPSAASSASENVTVKYARTEREIVAANNATYVRLTVTDHARPLDEEVDRFILAVRALPENGWAHFHCEAGRGRTTTFMVLYDMLRNASQVSLEDIARRQQLLGYDYDVLRSPDPGDWKAPYTEDRNAFVRAFYDYARANPGGRPQLWSEWLKSRTG